MELGFIPDVAEGRTLQQQWVKGVPRRKWWIGIYIKRGEAQPVETYRCKKCGLLRSYAK